MDATGRPGSASSHAQSGIYATPPALTSPYEMRDHDYMHDPKMLQAQQHGDPADQRRRHRHSRGPPGDMMSPGESPHHRGGRPSSVRSRSPDSHTGSSREARNQSFKKALDRSKGKDGVPLADEEDLSPVSPTAPTGPALYSPAKAPRDNRSRDSYDRRRAGAAEVIPMDSYNNKRFRDSGIEDTPLGLRSPDSDERQQSPPETRPPVEGRDSGTRQPHRPMADPHRYDYRRSPHSATPPGTPDRKNANYNDGRPDVKPLPLRHVQRPDGQSPENHHTDDPNATTPSSADGLSPMLQKAKLFPGNKSHTPSVLSLATQDGFEYDDYIPDLPGSYFTMDPHAYTLTWSSQPPWAGQKQPPRVNNSNSENSVSTQNNESHA